MTPRPFPDDDEQPWSEEDWLADMKRSGARADRFGELLETLRNDPDRDEQIAREMGWGNADEDDDDLDVPFEADAADEDLDDEDESAWNVDAADLEDHDEPEPPAIAHPAPDALLAGDADDAERDAKGKEEQEEEEDEQEERLFGREPARQIAEYRYAHRIGMKLHWMLKPYFSSDADEDPTDGLLGQALIGPHIASAKIVGGHSLGYSRHYINGNIACQRIGLDAVDKSIRAYEQLQGDGHLPADFVARILPEIRRLRDVLVERIERMRAYAQSLHAE